MIVVFVGSRRAWLQHLRLNCDVFKRAVRHPHVFMMFFSIMVRRVARGCFFSALRKGVALVALVVLVCVSLVFSSESACDGGIRWVASRLVAAFAFEL